MIFDAWVFLEALTPEQREEIFELADESGINLKEMLEDEE